jgi:hypothetical protein
MQFSFCLLRVRGVPSHFGGIVFSSGEAKCEPLAVGGDISCRKPLRVLTAICGIGHVDFAAVVDIRRIRLACIVVPLNRDARVQYVGGGDIPIGMRLRTGDEVKAKNGNGEKQGCWNGPCCGVRLGGEGLRRWLLMRGGAFSWWWVRRGWVRLPVQPATRLAALRWLRLRRLGRCGRD